MPKPQGDVTDLCVSDRGNAAARGCGSQRLMYGSRTARPIRSPVRGFAPMSRFSSSPTICGLPTVAGC